LSGPGQTSIPLSPRPSPAVDAGESSCDGVAAALALPGSEVAAALARLELLGYVICSPMGLYSRTSLNPSTKTC
jgi:predicted Rossmann fold nucleotide-binding protein DprA/Smf involved in DNA uptake